MKLSNDVQDALYESIARPSGGFAIVAADHRESLRTMFRRTGLGRVEDRALADFKVSIADLLGGDASAMLLDRHFGWRAIEWLNSEQPDCGVILAADRLIQEPGGPVTGTDLDRELDADRARERGVVGLKLHILWSSEENGQRCRQLAEEFVACCHKAGLLAILEGVPHPPTATTAEDWDREEALVEAAQALGSVEPDLYKTAVPFLGAATSKQIEDGARRISAELPCPWVVLSSGVKEQDFAPAVKATCRGGASGFLAGRYIWRTALRPEPGDYREQLRLVSLSRLRELATIVGSNASPWWEALSRA